MNRCYNVYQALVEFKRALNSEPKTVDLGFGLCANIPEYLNYPDCEFWDVTKGLAFEEWEEFSGSQEYPVPSFNFNHDACEAYMVDRKDMYSKKSAYGRCRRRLLDHLIEWYGDRI